MTSAVFNWVHRAAEHAPERRKKRLLCLRMEVLCQWFFGVLGLCCRCTCEHRKKHSCWIYKFRSQRSSFEPSQENRCAQHICAQLKFDSILDSAADLIEWVKSKWFCADLTEKICGHWMPSFHEDSPKNESMRAKTCWNFVELSWVKVDSTQRGKIMAYFCRTRINFLAGFMKTWQSVATYLLHYIGTKRFGFASPNWVHSRI